MAYKDKEAQREYQRQWVAKRRAEFFADKSCVLCGSTDRLELDHIDPSAKVSHRIWSWSEARRSAEIEKCQILCYYHHQEKTSKDKASRVVHGSYVMYTYRKCKCTECRAWKSLENKKRNRSNPASVV